MTDWQKGGKERCSAAKRDKEVERDGKAGGEKQRYGQRPKGAIGAQTDFRKNSGAPAFGKVGLGATREASVFEEVQSARTKNRPYL